PLSYQWWADGAQLSGATSRTLKFVNPTAGAQGTNFSVVVSSDSGSRTSVVAVLKLLSTNQPPIAPAYSYTVYSNQILNLDVDALYTSASDLDGDTLSLGSPAFDGTSTNGVTLVQNGTIVSYTPNAGYTGADLFNYYISDSQGAV